MTERRSIHPASMTFPAIDGLRAIAVVGVVIFHAFAFEAAHDGRPLPNLANIGMRGVELFFVISGFC